LLAPSNELRDTLHSDLAVADMTGNRCVAVIAVVCMGLITACSSTGPAKPDTADASLVGEPTLAEVRVEAATRPDTAEPPMAAASDTAVGGETRRDRRRRRREADRADGQVAEASDAASVVVSNVPNGARVSHQRAVAAMAAEDWFEAELELEQLVLEYTAYAAPYVNLAIVYSQDGRVEEARRALDYALAIDPDHAAANNQIGILAREAGEFEAAEAAYRRAIASDPGYALAHYNLGVLLDLYLGRRDEALNSYELFQSLLAEPDVKVRGWIIDLRRQLGVSEPRVAQENSL
jgi:lipoprotein NlpI